MFKNLVNTIGNIAKSIEEGQRLKKEEQEGRLRQEREYVEAISLGRLPTYPSKLLLNPSEFCYLEDKATYRKVLKNTIKDEIGVLTVTNTRLIFTSSSGVGSWSVKLDKILSIKGLGKSFEVNTGGTRASGTLFTVVSHAGLILESATKLSKRLMAMPGDDSSTKNRRISQEVRVSVWQRDAGKCTQCKAAEYLEFDHIIPFSLGGSNDEQNIQLLCRNCNLKKSNRV